MVSDFRRSRGSFPFLVGTSIIKTISKPDRRGLGMDAKKNDMKDQLKKGWRIIIAAALIMWLAYGMRMCTITLLTKNITEELGIARGPFSFFTTFRYMMGFAVNLFFGKIIRRYGVRNVLAAGFLFTSIGELLYGFSSTLPMFYFAGAISGAGSGLAGASAVALIVGDHFASGRGTILGITSAFSGIGAAFFNPVVGIVTGSFGWRPSFYLSTIVSAIAGGSVLFLMRSHERKIGKEGVHGSDVSGQMAEKVGIPLADARRMPAFSLLMLTGILLGMSTASGYLNYPAHLTDTGFDFLFVSSVAAVVLSIFNSLGKIIFGALNDRFGIGKSATVPLAMTALGMAAAIYASPESVWLAIFAGVGLGFGICANTIVPPFWVSGVFGTKDSATIMGYTSAMILLGSAVGMPLSNWLFDLTGDYGISYFVFMIMILIVLVLNLTVLGNKRLQKYQ